MSSKPNILIFMTDQQQAQVVDPEHPCDLPNVESLASQGLRFSRVYTPTAHCCPSRASFMTGLYPSQHGVFNNVLNEQAINRGLKPGVITFSEHLRDAGYSPTFAGKWHVTAEELPSDRGWDELFVTSKRGDYNGRPYEVWETMASQSDEEGPRWRGEIIRHGWGRFRLYGSVPNDGVRAYEGTNDYRVVSSALEALPSLAKRDNPWCLFIGTHGPHDPFVIPEKYANMYDPKEIDLPPNYGDTLEDKPRVYQRLKQQVWGQLDEDEVRESIAHYWGYCRMLDDMFGEVLGALDQTGQSDNTVVIFMSDHGEYCGAHGLYLKGVPAFDEGSHIPLVIRWPKGIKEPGRVVEEFVSLVDFAPTFLELARVDVPQELSGRSITPFFDGVGPSDWPDAFYSQFNGVELYYSQRVVQTKRYKYVFNGFDFDELYDLQSDPYEMKNLANKSEMEPIKRELIRKLWRMARREHDIIHNPYPTVALMPYGPAEGIGKE